MRDDPSVQIRSVRFLGGITSPAIILSQFALNKVIAHMASLESIRVEFAQQSRDRFTGRLGVGVLKDCADHPSAIDSFPKGPLSAQRNCQTSGPRLRPLLIRLPCCIPASGIAVAMRRNSYAGDAILRARETARVS